MMSSFVVNRNKVLYALKNETVVPAEEAQSEVLKLAVAIEPKNLYIVLKICIYILL